MMLTTLALYALITLAVIALCGLAHAGQLALESRDYQRHLND